MYWKGVLLASKKKMRVSTAQNEMPIWALLTDKDVPKCLCTKWQLHFYCSKGVWEWWGLAASLSAFPWHILKCHSAEAEAQERSSGGVQDFSTQSRVSSPVPFPKGTVPSVLHHASSCLSQWILQNQKRSAGEHPKQ